MTQDGSALLEITPAEAAARGGSGGGAAGDEAAYQLCALVRVECAMSPNVVGARLLARCWRISARIEQIRAGASDAPDAPDALVGAFLELGR